MNYSEQIANYALAIYELADEDNNLENIFNDFQAIDIAINENKEILKILKSYSLEDEQKFKLIDDIMHNGQPILIDFLKVLVRNRTIGLTCDIFAKFQQMYYEKKNIEQGIIYSTIKLSEQEIKDFEQKMTAKFNKNIILVNKLEPNLIGGIKIVIGDNVVDNSILAQLKKMKQTILN
ncbi:F0F1 ATP synthase subunit delta [Mycoplasma sp. 1573]